MKVYNQIFILTLAVLLLANHVFSLDDEEEDQDQSDSDDETTSANSASSDLTTPSTTSKDSSEDSWKEMGNDEEESDNEPQPPTRPYQVEGESLVKLQKFMLNSVESTLKDMMPTIIRSGLETNVSLGCQTSFLSLVAALRDSQIWAFRMLDASGKMPSGILEGTLTDLGSFDQCLSINSVPKGSDHFTGQYCLVDMRPSFDENIPLGSNPPPGITETDLVWDHSLQMFWANNDLLAFRGGACIPSTCSKEDFEQLVNYLVEKAGMEGVVHSCQTQQLNDSRVADPIQWVIITSFLFILFVVGLGTSIDYYLMYKDIDVDGQRSLLNLVTRFSIHKNTASLLSANGASTLTHLDGLRTISISWIILGHTYFYTDIVHYHHYRRMKQLYLVDDNPLMMWLSNFTFSVDTFFHISGVLLIYSSWRKMERNDGRMNIFNFFIHRLWRIWPGYFATIGLALVLPLFGTGPLWPLAVESTAQTCRKSWLHNILFVNNFQKPDQLCLLHTWFLSANIQFHVLGGIILYVMYRSPKVGVIVCSGLTVASSVASFAFAYVNRIRTPSVIAYEVFAHDSEQKILQLYMMPYNHFGSYLSGILIGYFLVRFKETTIPKTIQGLLWTLSAVVAIVTLFGPFQSYQSVFPTLFESGLYYAFARTSWSWAIGWVVFACATGRGGPVNGLLSWSFFKPLSGLSFLTYLLHPLLMLLHTGRIRERIYFGHYELVNIFMSRLVFSFLLAYAVYVLIEAPFAALEGYLLPSKSKKGGKSIKQVLRSKSYSCCSCCPCCTENTGGKEARSNPFSRLNINFRKTSDIHAMSFTKTDSSC